MPLTNWSSAHGDLRAAHFFGLHGLQILPLVAWASGRLRGVSVQQRAQLVIAAGLSYGALLLLLVAQALRGQAVTSLDEVALVALGLWAGATAALVGRALFARAALEPTRPLSRAVLVWRVLLCNTRPISTTASGQWTI